MNALRLKFAAICLALICCSASNLYAQQATLINYNENWKFNAVGAEPAGSWKLAALNDAAWSSGTGRFGFNDPGINTCAPAGPGCANGTPGNCVPTGTCTKYWTTYFRKSFTIADKSQYSGFLLNVIRDDGAVIYINGVEVWRTNMNAGAVSYSTPATTNVDAPDESTPFTSPIFATTAFVNGVNEIAVEVHQQNTNSSDLSFDLQLMGVVQGTSILPFGSSWKYWANTEANAPAANWTGAGAFDESAWPSGQGQLGFGQDGEVTNIPAGCGTLGNPGACGPKFTTTYFRRTVNIPNPAAFQKYLVSLRRDDGAIVYVNGTEVFRSNMKSGPATYSTFADQTVDEGAEEDATYTSPFIPNTAFVAGDNIIAVEIHQINATSSDLIFDLALSGANTPASANEVVYMWSGAITPSSAKVNAKLTNATSLARLVASTSSSLTSPIYGAYGTADSWNNNVAALSISGLAANTKYYYAIETDGITDNSADDIGSFRTPASGASSFKFTVGSCAQNSNHPVFTKMGEKSPLFQLISGDFHYVNPNSGTDINVHRTPYENNMLSQTATRNLFLNVPLAYVWDDHDYSGNDSDSLSAGRVNARLAYQEYVPHYQLAAGTGNVPIYQSFVIGRVRFILSDLRSMRGIGNTGSTSSALSMMGAVQKQWFKDECITARNNGQIIAWVTSVSFGGNQTDNWGGFRAERAELSNFFRDNNIQNMFLLSGDAHMLAIDNGTNHDFTTGGTAPPNNPFDYPVFQTAALNQSGSTKGGTYSEGGTIPNPSSTDGQYGLVEVTDIGGNTVTIKFTGYRVNSAGTTETQMNTYTFVRTLNISTPVKFSAFSVRSNNNGNTAVLNWKSEIETDCAGYQIERSTDGVSFTTIGSVGCQGTALREYTIEDKTPANGWNYYRIKASELSGKTTYTDVKKIFLSGKIGLKLSPVPAKDFVTIDLSNVPATTSARYILYNIKYKMQEQGQLQLNPGSNKIRLPLSRLAAGAYILNVVLDGVEITERFIKQ